MERFLDETADDVLKMYETKHALSDADIMGAAAGILDAFIQKHVGFDRYWLRLFVNTESFVCRIGTIVDEPESSRKYSLIHLFYDVAEIARKGTIEIIQENRLRIDEKAEFDHWKIEEQWRRRGLETAVIILKRLERGCIFSNADVTSEAAAIVNKLLIENPEYRPYENLLQDTTEKFIHRLLFVAGKIGNLNLRGIRDWAEAKLLQEEMNYILRERGAEEVCPKCRCPYLSVLGFNMEKVSYECKACHTKWIGPRTIVPSKEDLSGESIDRWIRKCRKATWILRSRTKRFRPKDTSTGNNKIREN